MEFLYDPRLNICPVHTFTLSGNDLPENLVSQSIGVQLIPFYAAQFRLSEPALRFLVTSILHEESEEQRAVYLNPKVLSVATNFENRSKLGQWSYLDTARWQRFNEMFLSTHVCVAYVELESPISG